MIRTIAEVKKYLSENYGKYNIIYNDEDNNITSFFLKGRKIKLPISKSDLKKEYEFVYKAK